MSLIIPAIPVTPETCRPLGAGTSWPLTEDLDQTVLPRYFIRPRTILFYAMTCKRLRVRVNTTKLLVDLYHFAMRCPTTGEAYQVASLVFDLCMKRESLSLYTRIRQAWVIMYRIFLRTLRRIDSSYTTDVRCLHVLTWPHWKVVLEWREGKLPTVGPSEAERFVAKFLDLEVGELASGTHSAFSAHTLVTIDFDRKHNGYALHPFDPLPLWRNISNGDITMSIYEPVRTTALLWNVVKRGLSYNEKTDEEKEQVRKRFVGYEHTAIWPALYEYTLS